MSGISMFSGGNCGVMSDPLELLSGELMTELLYGMWCLWSEWSEFGSRCESEIVGWMWDKLSEFDGKLKLVISKSSPKQGVWNDWNRKQI
jgi:hypothetical protein